jgi:hypothetical protein
MGSIDASMYRSGRWRRFPAARGCPAYMEVAGDVVAPYRGVWLGIHPERIQTRRQWCSLLSAIFAAPPA